jgi:NAD(P)-dependent dehydrogenase (short-subunit alcohol dehydrogenase family)
VSGTAAAITTTAAAVIASRSTTRTEPVAPAGTEGKVAFITGAAGSIGAATARRFADEGARLVLSDVEPMDDLGGEALTVSADVTHSAQVVGAVLSGER